MPKRDGIPFEELLARFQEKLAMVPPDMHRFVALYLAYRAMQRQRVSWGNRVVAATEKDSRVAWAHALDDGGKALIAESSAEVAKAFKLVEGRLQRQMEAIKGTEWFREVVLPAGRGYVGANTACALLANLGSASRFATVGKLWVYCGLDVRGGRAPSMWRRVVGGKRTADDQGAVAEWIARNPDRGPGSEMKYNDGMLSVLYQLSETWNKASVRVPVLAADGQQGVGEDGKPQWAYTLDPDCSWRQDWDALKAAERERRPDERPAFHHNKARRKVLRKFMADLWRLWIDWEAKRAA